MNHLLLSFTNQNADNYSVFTLLIVKERLIGFTICFVVDMLLQFITMGYIVGALLTWKKNILVCKKLIILISTTATTSNDVVAVV